MVPVVVVVVVCVAVRLPGFCSTALGCEGSSEAPDTKKNNKKTKPKQQIDRSKERHR